MGWEVVAEVEPISLLHPNPWEFLLCIAYCYAMLVDVVLLSVSMTDVRVVK